jgi:hypothetical protein
LVAVRAFPVRVVPLNVRLAEPVMAPLELYKT